MIKLRWRKILNRELKIETVKVVIGKLMVRGLNESK
jgi:hypothetical protein